MDIFMEIHSFLSKIPMAHTLRKTTKKRLSIGCVVTGMETLLKILFSYYKSELLRSVSLSTHEAEMGKIIPLDSEHVICMTR